MCITISKMSFYWIIGLLVLWSGVITAYNVTAAPGVGTTTSDEISAFNISIKITNRIYNKSLEDHQSQDYTILREDVEKVFFEIYSSAQFQRIEEMSFSNGSVIANSTVLFGTKDKSGQTLQNIFIANYRELPLMTLQLDINYTAAHEPIPVPLSPLPNVPDSETTTSPNNQNHTESSDHTESSNHTLHETSTSTTTVNPSSSISATSATSPSTMTLRTSSISTESTPRPSTTSLHTSSISTESTPRSSTTSLHTSSISTESTPRSSTISLHTSSISTESTPRSSTTSLHTGDISVSSASSPSTTTLLTSSISAESTPRSSFSPGKTVTQNATLPEGSGTVETEQGVPGWGIAILVLAAIILFFMLVLLIMLLLFCCCWWRQRGFMNVSDPDPMGYYNPDIPMYSTHSTYGSHNGKSLDSHSRPS